MTFTCGNCDKCEHELNGSFFPGEEHRLQYFKGAVFQREGVWFLGECPYHKNGKCTVHEEPWRPIQCQIYPCYLDYGGFIKIDWEGCPKAHLVDKKYLSKVESLIMSLNLPKKKLNEWLKVVSKYNKVGTK